MGFKFSIEYKSGASNRVADALSRRDPDDQESPTIDVLPQPDTLPSLLAAFARPRPTVMADLERENRELPDLIALHEAVRKGAAPAHVSVAEGLLYFKRRFYLSRDSSLRSALLGEFHDSRTAGHPGERRTFSRIAATFFWLGMRKDVQDYVAACTVCQATKYITKKPAGLLQPLPIPDKVWAAASMDFIVGLPPSYGYTAVMVVVDRLSKYAHFGALRPGFDAKKVADLFVDTVVKHHGFPDKLLSDRDAIFMSNLWTELLTMSGTKLQFTTAYHPQTDGQSEVTNRGLEQYLRAFTFDHPKRWSTLLPWAELALNCNYHASIGTSPFMALYGREPPNIFTTAAIPAKNIEVAEMLKERAGALETLKRRLCHAQIVMSETANRHRRNEEYAVGDQVWLKLQPYRQHSVGKPPAPKLGRRFYGPFKITERIGKVAYRLELPVESRIHDVFHVSLLKTFVPPLTATMQQEWPRAFHQSRPIDVPIRAEASRTVLVNGIPQEQWLIYWSSHPTSDPSWEPADTIRLHFPDLRLEDKSVCMDGGVDRTSTMHDEATPDNEPQATENADMQDESEQNEESREAETSVAEEKKVERPKRKTSRPARYRDYSSH